MTTCCRSHKSSARSRFAELCAFMFYGSATACQGKYLGSVPLQSLLSFEAHAPVGINLSLLALLHTPERARFGIDSCRAAVLIKALPQMGLAARLPLGLAQGEGSLKSYVSCTIECEWSSKTWSECSRLNRRAVQPRLPGQFLSFVVVPPTTEVGVRDMCPSSGSASPKATVAMRQVTSIVEGADLRVGRSGV